MASYSKFSPLKPQGFLIQCNFWGCFSLHKNNKNQKKLQKNWKKEEVIKINSLLGSVICWFFRYFFIFFSCSYWFISFYGPLFDLGFLVYVWFERSLIHCYYYLLKQFLWFCMFLLKLCICWLMLKFYVKDMIFWSGVSCLICVLLFSCSNVWLKGFSFLKIEPLVKLFLS